MGMSEQDMVKVHRVWDEEVLGKGKLELVEDLLNADYVSHDPTRPDLNGIEGAKGLVTMLRNAFPDLNFTVRHRFAGGQKLVVQWTGHGTHEGDLAGVAPTGKKVEFEGTSIHRFEGGKISESWEAIDYYGLFQQLGVIPENG